jgi:aryl-alcohol dehydrogenase-like predicted oxidoreductase
MTDMRYTTLGDSGLRVSVVGVGCNNFGRPGSRTADLAGTKAVVDAAIDAGITLFDTADVYGGQGKSEELFGEALAGRHGDVVVATKFGGGMGGVNGPDWEARGSRRYIRRAVESSLRRLRAEHIDLYQYHMRDQVTPIEETLAALTELVDEGKVRYLGSSNFSGWHVVEADFLARSANSARFISAQNHYSLLERGAETELAPACESYGVGILPYFPLANGLLTGKYTRGAAAPEGTRLAQREQVLQNADWDAVEGLAALAEKRDVSLLHVAIGGLAAQPAVSSVIAGATSPEQVVANAEAGLWEPSVDDLADIDAITSGKQS